MDPGISDYKHAIDLHTFQGWRMMSSSIQVFVARSKRAAPNCVVPPAHDILPFVISVWNRQDVCSRILKNIKVDFRNLKFGTFQWIRFIMTAMMNAHMVLRLLRLEDQLNQFYSYEKIKQYLNHDSTFWNFVRDTIQDWKPSMRFMMVPSDIGSEKGQEMMNSNEMPLPNTKRKDLSYLNRGGVNGGKQRRLDQTLPHRRASKSSRQFPCCKARTTAYCTTCDVNLCVSKAQGSRATCWERCHSVDMLTARKRPPRLPQQRGRRGRIFSTHLATGRAPRKPDA